MRKDNLYQQSVALLETLVADMWTRDERKCLVTNNTITIPPYHVSIILLKPVDHMVLWPNTWIERDENPFPSIEQHGIAILQLLQKVGDRLPDEFITALWDHGGPTITLKKYHYLACQRSWLYIKTYDLVTRWHFWGNWDFIWKVTTHDWKSAFMFHHTFYPRHKIDLEDAKISWETQKKNYKL